MLATDLFEAFNDVGFENKAKIKDVGIKYDLIKYVGTSKIFFNFIIHKKVSRHIFKEWSIVEFK